MPEALNAQSKKPINMPGYDNETFHYGFILSYNQTFLSANYIENYQTEPHIGGLPPIDGINDSFKNYPYYIQDITTTMRHGLTIGFVGNIRLSQYFDLRLIPSISPTVERTVYYQIKGQQETENGIIDKVVVIPYSLNSTCIGAPIQIKYKAKRNCNNTAYIIAGANPQIDLGWVKADKSNNQDNTEETSNNIELLVNKFDIAAEIGAGFDFYTGFIKFGVELKMSYGLFDIRKKEGNNNLYSNSFDNLRNKVFYLSFTIE